MVKNIEKSEFQEIPLNDLDLPSRWWGAIPLFNQRDAFKLIGYCELNGYGILGIEGFNFENNSRIPNMDAIVDFSELMRLDPNGFKEKSIMIAKNFLDTFMKTEIEFEFCLIK